MLVLPVPPLPLIITSSPTFVSDMDYFPPEFLNSLIFHIRVAKWDA